MSYTHTEAFESGRSETRKGIVAFIRKVAASRDWPNGAPPEEQTEVMTLLAVADAIEAKEDQGTR